MKKPKIYYKVVSVLEDGRKVSCIMGKRNDETSLEYEEGKWTKPKIKKSKILIFDDRMSAESFYNGSYDFSSKVKEIWEVIAWGKVKSDILIGYADDEIKNIIIGWLHGNRRALPPIGTLGALKIKLIKKV